MQSIKNLEISITTRLQALAVSKYTSLVHESVEVVWVFLG